MKPVHFSRPAFVNASVFVQRRFSFVCNAVATATLCLTASAQTTTFIAEPQMSKRPLDVEVTPNGLVAVVRGHAPTQDKAEGLVFVETTTGTKLTPQGSCHPNMGQGGYFYTSNNYQPSDSLRLTNSRAILIGGRDLNGDGQFDRSYVDILAIDVSTSPPTVACMYQPSPPKGHHEFGSLLPNEMAGWVNDVEITPDESFAIVNSQNWIHVLDLATGAVQLAENIGSSPWAGPCFTGDSVDSVATTNDTAVVITTRVGLSVPPFNFMRTWVYLIDLTGSSTPTIVLEHELTGPLPTTERDFWPHDVTITPDGSFAIVTANNAVAVYDLDQHTFLGRDIAASSPTGLRRRYFSDIVDSVEATNTRFVTTATDEWIKASPCGPVTTRLWVAEVYELPPVPDLQMEIPVIQTYALRNDTTFQGCNEVYGGSLALLVDAPHDLALARDKDIAVLRSNYFNIVLTDLAAPDPSDYKLFVSPGVKNNQPGTTLLDAPNTFVSDSVLIDLPFIKHQLPPNGPEMHHYALTLGADIVTAGIPPKAYWKKAKVDVIDLHPSPPALVHTFEVVDPASFPHVYPADFHLGPVGRQFVLRNHAQANESGVVGALDFVRFDLDPLAEIAKIGANGRVWAVDGIEVGRFNATSVGENLSLSIGYVHVVRIQ